MLFSYVGPVLRFALSEWLVLALATPLIALAHAIWLGVSSEDAPKTVATRLRRIGLGALAVSAAIVLWQARPLANDARLVVQNVLRLVRIGQLDVALELALDPASLAMVLVALGAGAASLHVTKNNLTPRTAILVHLATSGAVLVSLADDAFVGIVGIGLIAGSAALSGRILGPGRLADGLLVLGAAAIFWSFGGRRTEGRYVPDLSPRVVAVASEHTEIESQDVIQVDPSGKTTPPAKAQHSSLGKAAYVSVDALPGSWVFVDDATTPFGTKTTPFRTPFAHAPIPTGMHSVRLHPAQGLDDYVVTQVFFDADHDVMLAPLGPTLVYRFAAAQETYAPPKGAGPHRDRTLLAAGLTLLALAVIARVRDVGPRTPPVGLAAAVIGAVVLVRFAPLANATTPWIFGILGSVTAAIFAFAATRAATRHEVCVDLATSIVGTAIAASAIGSGAAALAALVLGASGVSTLLLATRERTASLVACAGLSGAPVPLFGAPWVLAGTYGPALASPALGALCLLFGVVSAWASSYAVWRVNGLETEKKRSDRALVVLAAVGPILASVIAYAPRIIGAEGDGPIASFFAPAATKVGTPAFACAMLIAGAALAGRASARRARTLAPLSVLSRPWTYVVALALRAGRLAEVIDTHVVRFASLAVGGLAFAGGWLAIRVEEQAPLPSIAPRFRWSARRVAVFVAIVFAILFGASLARAGVHTEDGRRGPVELSDQGGVWRGRFVVENTGSTPLSISRIAIREDDAVRAPRGLSVKATSATIAPHESKRIEIEWKPDLEMGPPQVQGHVVLTTSDEEAGEIAIGVHAQLPGPLGPFEGHLLSLVIALPLIGALIALGIALAFPQGNARAMRITALATTLGQVALALVVVRRFVPDFGRESGNDGLQLVERASWIRPLAIEWYVGVDGHSVMLLALVALVGALGVASSRVERHVEGHLGTFLLAIAAASGACVARDLVLFLVFVSVCVTASAIVSGAFADRRAAGTMASFAIVAIVAIFFATIALRSGSTRTFLFDGSTSAHTFAMPELERIAFTRRAGSVAGVPLVELAFVLALGGFGILAGMFPFHAWMPGAANASPSSLLAAVVVPRLGMIGMVRVLAQILPEATRWASVALIGLGAVTALHAGACLLAERDLSRAAVRCGMLHTGMVLVGIGSSTPQGLAGASTIAFAGGVATALVLVIAAALESRVGTRDVEELGGLIHETPILASLGLLGLLGATATPGTAAFWGSLLAILGAAPTQPILAVLAAMGVAIGAAGAFRVGQRAFFGTVPETWRRSTALEPFGGKFPDLRTPEAWSAGALAVLIVVLGVWPAPMLDVMAGAVRDAVSRANLGPLQLGF